MISTLLPLAFFTALATFLGGLFALRFRDKSHLIVGFSAGAVIGVAFFDLLPESVTISSIGISTITALVVLGFLGYMAFDRIWGIHGHHTLDGHEHELESHEHASRGIARAFSLSLHSFLDGLGIGFAFQVSPVMGIFIAIGVLGHDFSDGINTVSGIIKSGGSRVSAFRWLLVDAIAPALGIFVTLFFTVQNTTLALILALFCGFFIYIGASDLVPESYHAHPTWKTTVATVLGVSFMYLVIHLVR